MICDLSLIRVGTARRSRKGLTLLELVVVMGVLVAIAGLLVPLLPNLIATANNATGAVNVAELTKECRPTRRSIPRSIPTVTIRWWMAATRSRRKSCSAPGSAGWAQRSRCDDLVDVRSHEPQPGGHHHGLQPGLCQWRHNGSHCNLPGSRYDDGHGSHHADRHAPVEQSNRGEGAAGIHSAGLRGRGITRHRRPEYLRGIGSRGVFHDRRCGPMAEWQSAGARQPWRRR